jgi:hypothetical protein
VYRDCYSHHRAECCIRSTSRPLYLFLFQANAGDSRTVLSRNGHAIALSEDHKPYDESIFYYLVGTDFSAENARITAAGGFVEDDRVNGVLLK